MARKLIFIKKNSILCHFSEDNLQIVVTYETLKMTRLALNNCIQGAEVELSSPLKNFHPPKMTQNDILCHFESFLGGENF